MDNFLYGFADELTKEGAEGGHPLFSSIKKGGTALGQKVKDVASSVMKRVKGAKPKPSRNSTAGAHAMRPGKAQLKKAASHIGHLKFADMDGGDMMGSGDGGDDDKGEGGEGGEDVLKAIIAEAMARLPGNEERDEQATPQSEGENYGTGKGNPTAAPKAKPVGKQMYR